MNRPRSFVARTLPCAMTALWISAMIQPASAQQSGESFTYHSPGVMTNPGDPGVKDRRVFFPEMKFPIKTGPEAAGDGRPLRAFANSQVFRPPGINDVNDPRLYVFPWVDTLCESHHRGGSMPVCPNPAHHGHQGVDIRPNAPNKDTFDVVAWVDGIAMNIIRTGTSQVRIRDVENTGDECLYLHLSPAANLSDGQTVRKGEVIGKVSNLMVGGTSIHLHIQCKANHPELRTSVNMPIHTSLISAYRRDWQLPDMIESGTLLRDPERELDPTPEGGGNPGCGEPLAAPLAATKDRPFKARYTHNCSEMGLTLDTATQNMEIVYVRPKQSLQQSAQRNPVLVSGKLAATGGGFTGQAINFNSACGDPKFDIAGQVDFSDTEINLEGDRQPLDSSCNPSGSPRHEALHFATLLATPPPQGGHPQTEGELRCPFALPPGQQPVVVDGRQIPPKSERSCNFTALTVPGGLTFAQMPRYIREWPGVRQDILIDAFEDQIITFQTAETGVGAWWYWVMNRAVNGPNLSTRGFTPNGKPTLSEVARAIAGAGHTDDFVRRTYLGPYLRFASEFSGRTMTETDQLDLTNPDVRWNLARTMFRLESGRTPVVSRKQFDCGIQLGFDVSADFKRANVETSSTGQVTFQAFKTLASYINCSPAGGPIASGDVANLDQAKQQIRDLTSRVTEMQQNLADRDQKLQLANLQIGDLQRRIAELTGTPPPPPDTTPRPSDSSPQTRILALQRALQLANQMFDSQRELCKLNQATCRPD